VERILVLPLAELVEHLARGLDLGVGLAGGGKAVRELFRMVAPVEGERAILRVSEAGGVIALEDSVHGAGVAADRAGGAELRAGDREERDEGALCLRVPAVGPGLDRHRIEIEQRRDLGVGGELGEGGDGVFGGLSIQTNRTS
jgi:hypothetical protein